MCLCVVPVVGVSVSVCCPCSECGYVCVLSLWWVCLCVVPVVSVGMSVC